jgi:hypothetical protein
LALAKWHGWQSQIRHARESNHAAHEATRKIGRRSLFATLGGATIAANIQRARADAATIRIGYIRWINPRPTISQLERDRRRSQQDNCHGTIDTNNA